MKVPSSSRRPVHAMHQKAGHTSPHKAAHASAERVAFARPYKPAHAISHRSTVATYRRPALASALSVAMAVGIMAGSSAGIASAAPTTTPNTLNLKVLVVGSGASDPTTAAWESALTSEGVPYTEVDANTTAGYGGWTVTLPALSSGSTGLYNGVIIADSPAAFSTTPTPQLSALFTYESTFGVNQIDGYTFPFYGETYVSGSGGALDGSTGMLTSAGIAALPSLKGSIPFDTGSYGYAATANAGAPFTPWLTCPSTLGTICPAGDVMAGVYQHPSTDPQANVSELELNFDYSSTMLQWLVLAPGLINWVTQGTHLGLDRNYFGQDIDDNFISDNEWSSQFQCTPAATDPPDYTCPTADQGVAAGSGPGIPADVQMSAADVAYVANWEQQTGIKLNLAFNAIGACSAPSAAAEPSAVCTGSYTEPIANGATFTDPGQVVDSSYPNDADLVNALLADKADFNWIIHTWSHLFLGCQVWAAAAPDFSHRQRLGRHIHCRQLQLRGHRRHRLRRVRAVHLPERDRRGQRLGRPHLARGRQRHGHQWEPGADARPRGGEPHRGHGLLGLQRLPGEPGLHDLWLGRPSARGPLGYFIDDVQLHRHRHGPR